MRQLILTILGAISYGVTKNIKTGGNEWPHFTANGNHKNSISTSHARGVHSVREASTTPTKSPSPPACVRQFDYNYCTYIVQYIRMWSRIAKLLKHIILSVWMADFYKDPHFTRKIGNLSISREQSVAFAVQNNANAHECDMWLEFEIPLLSLIRTKECVESIQKSTHTLCRFRNIPELIFNFSKWCI